MSDETETAVLIDPVSPVTARLKDAAGAELELALIRYDELRRLDGQIAELRERRAAELGKVVGHLAILGRLGVEYLEAYQTQHELRPDVARNLGDLIPGLVELEIVLRRNGTLRWD